ncbi:bifunctional ADP-dependent NAD(P)H-hydrate dehydratase/NAD(P)H-hydrate epimerase [Corynebacterium doosanense]|uniref:bifunctional ADP-dependent NAD(P)H-hydrate dehydratase/NAD(P)H-hydrate epimerase n=1 Tax=Corynebacterium doosanense TaxID=1121358 RepID=UPI00036F8891|nr:bifunctional ADP-dependent NAD(P)H-hydrate dehydratase/NAD(P)H-hydrate epimerase [Corynebacterium doosanense]
MPLIQHAHTADAIRAAEKTLIDAASHPDELMLSAARGVADVARAMLGPGERRVLLLVGSGGNGGDALYAGAGLLTAGGIVVEALLLGRDGKVHQPALDAFVAAGGEVVDGWPSTSVDLVIDGILGLGGSGGLSEEVSEAIQPARNSTVLAVDVPSGIGADDGVTPERFLAADVTVTFGGLRYAHGLSPHCGEVVMVEAQTHTGRLSEELIRNAGQHRLVWIEPVPVRTPREWPANIVGLTPQPLPGLEPGADDDKYSGGVVGIAAGSDTYPGAAVLCTLGAVRATNSMVRYAGAQALEVVRAHPEVIATESIADAGRVQAWVYGPGAGTDSPDDLAGLLDTDLPVLIDADGLTLLAKHPELREKVRTRRPATVLSPHSGEFARLCEAMELDTEGLNKVEATCLLAGELQAGVLHKGRATVVAYPSGEKVGATIVDTGSSWAATPGSGDVLSGIIGALLAWVSGRYDNSDNSDESFRVEYLALPDAVALQAMAAWLSAQTPDGPAPTSASRIGEAVPRAYARLRGRS